MARQDHRGPLERDVTVPLVPAGRPRSYSTLAAPAKAGDLTVLLTRPLDIVDTQFVRIGTDVVEIIPTSSPAVALLLKAPLTIAWPDKTSVMCLLDR